MFHTRIRAFVLVLLFAAAVAGCGRDPKAYIARGDAYVKEKKYAEASIEFRKAIQKDQRNGEARYRLGLVYEALGSRPAAGGEFIRAADLMPDNDEVQAKAGVYFLHAKRFEEAKRVGDKLLKKNPRNLNAQLLVANAYAGLKDLDAAVVRIEDAITLDPTRVDSYANLAAFELSIGNAEKAESAFRNAIAASPKSVEARLGLANLFWARGQSADAEALLKEALALEPRHPLANRTLAAFYLSSNRVAEAEAPLKMVADTAKDVAAPRLALADYYMATNRAAEGVKLLETVAQMKDGRSPASIRLAQYEYGNGQKAAAHARLDKLMAAEPKNVDAMLSKAALLASDGNLDAALRQATAATSAAPRLARAHFAVANIDESKGDVEHAEKAYQEALRLDPGFGAASLGLARLYLATGRGDQAVQFADQAVKDMPHRADGYYLLVRALMARGERDRTELQLKPLLARFGNLSKVQSLAGLVAASRSDSVAARKAFESALKIDPGNNEALSGLTAVDLADRKPADAVRRIEARRASAPTDVAALALAGRTYQMIGQPAQAEAAWKQVLERDGSNIEAYGSLAQLYMQQKRLPEARQEFERVAERHPKLAAAQTMVGYLLDLENRKPEALKRYQKALEIDPRSAVAANNAAWLYAEGAGNLETALQLAQTAKSGLPDSHEVNDTLGWIYYKKGMTTMALGPLFQAVDKAPKNAVYQFHLGMALAKNGEKDRARAALQAALAIDPNFDGAADARQTLASLR